MELIPEFYNLILYDREGNVLSHIVIDGPREIVLDMAVMNKRKIAIKGFDLNIDIDDLL
jgi:hypothetical protein